MDPKKIVDWYKLLIYISDNYWELLFTNKYQLPVMADRHYNSKNIRGMKWKKNTLVHA